MQARGSAVAALVAGASLGLTGIVGQLSVAAGYSVMHLTTAQLVVGVVILGATALVRRAALPRGRALAFLILAGVLYSAATFCYYLAVDALSVGQATALMFQYVWLTVLIECLLARRRPERKELIVMLLVFVGSVLASGVLEEIVRGEVGGADAHGLALGCALAVLYALYYVVEDRAVALAPQIPAVSSAFIVAVAGVATAFVIDPSFLTATDALATLVPSGLIMSLANTVLPCTLIALASASLSGGTIAVLTSVELPVATIAGCVFLGEVLTPAALAGIALILVGVWLLQR